MNQKPFSKWQSIGQRSLITCASWLFRQRLGGRQFSLAFSRFRRDASGEGTEQPKFTHKNKGDAPPHLSLTSALVGANCLVCQELSFYSVTMSWAHAKS